MYLTSLDGLSTPGACPRLKPPCSHVERYLALLCVHGLRITLDGRAGKGYDMAMATRRPSMVHTVKVRVTEKEWRDWQRASQKDGFSSVSEWLRRNAKKIVQALDGATT